MTRDRLILLFPEIRATGLPTVGGRGINFGEMTHVGLPVPQRFCLTADPLTGHRHTIMIDASYGLGEALVSGKIIMKYYW
ncbi:MAG: hypothetical protein ACFFBD_00805 [Candidatus Hodarchaeota archaeon]